MKGVLFKRTLLLFMVIVLLAGILLLGAYSYFGRRTYINLELESLDTVLRTATEMYQSQPTDRDTYTNAIKFISIERIFTSR